MEAENEPGRRYVVNRVVYSPDGGVMKIPLMAFDTRESAAEYAQSEAEFLMGMPPEIQMLFRKVGIAKMAMNITEISTPDGVRRIELATALPPTNGKSLLLKG